MKLPNVPRWVWWHLSRAERTSLLRTGRGFRMQLIGLRPTVWLARPSKRTVPMNVILS